MASRRSQEQSGETSFGQKKFPPGPFKKSMRLLLVATAVMAVLLMAPWRATPAQAQENTRVVEGQVANGTANGGTAAGLTVIFHQENASLHRDLEATTDGEGRFRFEGISYVPGIFYGVSIKYQDALYGQDMDLSAGSPPFINLKVYEATDSEDVLSATMVSVLFSDVEKRTQTVRALEIVNLRNNADRSYVPGPAPMKLVRFGLPPDAQELQVETNLLSSDFIQVDRGFALTGAVPPGEHLVMYSYSFPYTTAAVTLSKSLPYGAEQVRVLAPTGLVAISSFQLGNPQLVTIGSTTYQLLEGEGLPRGGQFTIELAGLPKASLWDSFRHRVGGIPFQYAAPALVGLLGLALLAFALWRRAGKGRSDILTADASQALLRSLADLDKRFNAGELAEAEYRSSRSTLRAKLVALPRQEAHPKVHADHTAQCQGGEGEPGSPGATPSG